MSDTSKIEWTNTYHTAEDGTVTVSPGSTWNPIRGVNGRHTCARISSGCENCYAATMNRRGLGGTEPLDFGAGETLLDPARLDERALVQPLRWKKPRRVFVCSMTDLFGSWVPDEWLDRIFAVMALAPRHTFMVLTKRPAHLAKYLNDLRGQLERLIGASRTLGYGLEFERTHLFDWPLPNVWAGVTIEADRYTWRANYLRQTPAAVRWISAEPLLSGLSSLDLTGIDWVVAGSESGHRSQVRTCDLNWVRDLRDRCTANGTAFFWKQHAVNGRKTSTPELDGKVWTEYPTVAVPV